MRNKRILNILLILAVILIAFFLRQSDILNPPEQPPVISSGEGVSDRPLISKDEVAAYLREYGELPPNFLTKKEAQELGWVASQGNLHDVAPGMSIGGDRFYNREKLLPEKEGRLYYECDIGYEGGRRGPERLVFSNDGLIFYTGDHYESFEPLQ